MKRTIILAFTLAATSLASAQSAKELERAGFVRDSVAEVLAEHRASYAKSESAREQLAPTILSLEKEVARLQAVYDKLVTQLSQGDIQKALTVYEQAKQQSANTPKEQKSVEVNEKAAYTPDKARMKRDLVANDYFVERLSPSDYKTLREAQQREKSVSNHVAKYIAEYGSLLALQRSYMEVPTKHQADSVAQLFAAKKAHMAELDDAITSAWSSLYYN